MATDAITWQDIIDQDMVPTSNVSHMVIYQIDSKMRLAGTKGYYLPEKDFNQCIDVFANPQQYLINGITLFEGVLDDPLQFLVAKADSRSFYAKRGATSCFGGRSAGNILLLLFAEPPVLPGRTANALEALLDYLDEYKI